MGLNLEARGLDASPVLALAGKPEPLLEVAEEDAAAYNEDWTGLRGRGGPVTRARLARWWEAVGRDLVLITVSSERPQFAAALAPEGRVLGQVFDAAQPTGRPGVPRQVVDEERPPLRDGLRLLALRVPGSENVGQALVQVAPAADPVEFRFAAEPFTAAPGRPHAVLTTGLGPAFVLAASGGKTAAARAVEAAARLNAAAVALRTTVGLSLEARVFDAAPVVALAGRPEPLLEVTHCTLVGIDEQTGAINDAGADRWTVYGKGAVTLYQENRIEPYPENQTFYLPIG